MNEAQAKFATVLIGGKQHWGLVRGDGFADLSARETGFRSLKHVVEAGKLQSLADQFASLAPDHDGKLPDPAAREGGTAAAVTLAVLGGAHAVRVHDVAAMRQAVALAERARDVEVRS